MGHRVSLDHRWRRPGFVCRRSFPGVQRYHRRGVPAPSGRRRDLGARCDGQQHELTEGTRFTEQYRYVFASFPEVTKVVSQAGAPDDGTDTGGFGNTEYFVDLKPKEQWRPVFHQNKEELIAAMDREVEKHPGAFWNFSQPIEDNVDETMTGTKGGLAAKLYGPDLDVLEEKGEEIKDVMAQIHGVKDLGIQRDTGQPNLDLTVDRQAAARFGINVADVQDAIQTAVGGFPVSQVLQGEAVYNVVVRYQKPYRDTKEAIQNIRLLSPSGERVSLAQVTKVQVSDDAYDIYRENGSRYVAIRFEVRGRDLGTTVRESIDKIAKNVQLPRGYHLEWSGEYDSEKRAEASAGHRASDHLFDLHHSLRHVSFVQMGAADSGQRGHGSRWRLARSLCDRHTSSAYLPVSASWRSSASRFRRASSCLNTSTN